MVMKLRWRLCTWFVVQFQVRRIVTPETLATLPVLVEVRELHAGRAGHDDIGVGMIIPVETAVVREHCGPVPSNRSPVDVEWNDALFTAGMERVPVCWVLYARPKVTSGSRRFAVHSVSYRARQLNVSNDVTRAVIRLGALV